MNKQVVAIAAVCVSYSMLLGIFFAEHDARVKYQTLAIEATKLTKQAVSGWEVCKVEPGHES